MRAAEVDAIRRQLRGLPPSEVRQVLREVEARATALDAGGAAPATEPESSPDAPPRLEVGALAAGLELRLLPATASGPEPVGLATAQAAEPQPCVGAAVSVAVAEGPRRPAAARPTLVGSGAQPEHSLGRSPRAKSRGEPPGPSTSLRSNGSVGAQGGFQGTLRVEAFEFQGDRPVARMVELPRWTPPPSAPVSDSRRAEALVARAARPGWLAWLLASGLLVVLVALPVLLYTAAKRDEASPAPAPAVAASTEPTPQPATVKGARAPRPVEAQHPRKPRVQAAKQRDPLGARQ